MNASDDRHQGFEGSPTKLKDTGQWGVWIKDPQGLLKTNDQTWVQVTSRDGRKSWNCPARVIRVLPRHDAALGIDNRDWEDYLRILDQQNPPRRQQPAPVAADEEPF